MAVRAGAAASTGGSGGDGFQNGPAEDLACIVML